MTEEIAVIVATVIVMTMVVMSMIVMTVIIVTVAVIMIIFLETSVLQEIIDDRRSRAGVNVGREKMIQLRPVQIVRRHEYNPFKRSASRTPSVRSGSFRPILATARFRPLALHNNRTFANAAGQSQSMVDAALI